ncbi:maltose ABC transporter permease MalG [Candidatus Bipolaricaulota bacterium]|nr:maltose ABC transporter permease MalG [Candidatus Bipolaricaulota bacterium]MBC7099194.1 maltose ABC transporter permease MalG [Candidatus Bipolaricaulota bacterium]
MYRRPTLVGTIIRHLIIWIAIAFALFPVVWILSASFNPTNTLVGQRLIPRNPTIVHYLELFNNPQHPFPIWIANSVKVAGLTALFSVILTALGAYAFSRFRFRGRRGGLMALLLVQMFPQMLAMVALYILLLRLGDFVPAIGLNTHTGLILVYLGGALGFNTWLMKGYFDTIPRSLEESAMIDGATHFQAFTRIILPLARPILAVVFILQFIATYSEYLLASVLLTGVQRYTLAVGLRLFITGQYTTRWGVFAAASIIGALPIVLIFYLLQNQLISGLTRGAVKG